MYRLSGSPMAGRTFWGRAGSMVVLALVVGASVGAPGRLPAQEFQTHLASLTEVALDHEGSRIEKAPERGEPISAGMVLIHGKVLPPPHVVMSQGDQLVINNVPFDAAALAAEASRARRGRDNKGVELRQLQARVEGLLLSEGLIVQFSDGAIGWFRADSAFAILSVLAGEGTKEDKLRRLMSEHTELGDFTSTQWSTLITNFKATPELREHLAKPLHEEEYPPESPPDANPTAFLLIVGGMCLTVFSFGVVLTYRPPVNLQWKELNPSPEAVQLVVRCSILIAALGIFDLLCTYLVSPANSFWEMNPVGAALIDQPITLVLFKLVFTGLSIGILFKLRTYRGAQLASWWACLLLTLLSIRWVAFNSFFMS